MKAYTINGEINWSLVFRMVSALNDVKDLVLSSDKLISAKPVITSLTQTTQSKINNLKQFAQIHLTSEKAVDEFNAHMEMLSLTAKAKYSIRDHKPHVSIVTSKGIITT